MKTVGIIAEYNPFHLGHAYHIQKAKEISGADYCIVVMSGNYVQRGAPSIMDKYTRTRMALENGADIVFEMPCAFSTSAAPIFADSGVSILNHLGCVDFLCFGSESYDLPGLFRIADILTNEPDDFKNLLQNHLRLGNSYPKSIHMALYEYLETFCHDDKNLINIVSSPNDTLAIEYLKALLKYKSSITPICVKREGNGYHADSLDGKFASASAIRLTLEQGLDIDIIKPFVPDNVYNLMNTNFHKTFPVTEDDFSFPLSMVLHCGHMINGIDIAHAAEMTKELSDRIQKKLSELEPFSFSTLAEALKTKNITRSRINRALLHAMLGISNHDMNLFESFDFCPYARLLGFKKASSQLLHVIKENADIPMLTKMADASNKLNEEGNKLLSHELNAAFLYRQAVFCRFGATIPDEYRVGPVIM